MYQYERIAAGTASYGILCRERQDGTWIIAAAAAPLSQDREAVKQLAKQCTVLQLDPEQLLDVAADFISSRRLSGDS